MRAVVLVVLVPILFASGQQAHVAGLDHVPVAVRNLEQAADDFRRLGFLIKPGRVHDDGIRNMHMKFANGGGIELITANHPTDALATEYAEFLKGGDGPAAWSLYSTDLVSLTMLLTRLKLAPANGGDTVTISQTALAHRVFFADRLRSPSDGPQYWAHPNTAYRVKGVWLAAGAGEQKLLPELGAREQAKPACAPFDHAAKRLVLPGEGDEVMLSSATAVGPDRTTLGITVQVRSLAIARQVLEGNRVAYERPRACGDGALWVAPADAHGLWIQMLE